MKYIQILQNKNKSWQIAWLLIHIKCTQKLQVPRPYGWLGLDTDAIME
jgi:hypothetical protein